MKTLGTKAPRLIRLYLALVACLPLAVLGTAPSPADTTDDLVRTVCSSHTSVDSALAYPHGAHVDVHALVAFRYCVGHYHHWWDPTAYRVSYDVHGSNNFTNCGWSEPFHGITFRGYFFDGRGVNHNTAERHLTCRDDTTNEGTYSLRLAPNFRYCHDYPKWKINVTVNMGYGIDDQHLELSGRFAGVQGPQPNEC